MRTNLMSLDYRYGYDHPEVDGRYVCLMKWGKLDDVNFTTKYGWNSSLRNSSHVLDDEDIWVWFPTIEVDLADRIMPVYECMDCGHHFVEFAEKTEHYVDNHGGDDIFWSEEVKCCPKCHSENWKEWGV